MSVRRLSAVGLAHGCGTAKDVCSEWDADASEKKSVVPKRSFFGCSDGARRPETRNAEQLETRDRRRAQPVRGLKNTATGSRDPRDPLGGPWADRSFNYFSGRLLSTASVPGPIRGCTIRAAVDVVDHV